MYYAIGDFLKKVYYDKYGSNAEIKALYFVTPNDKILIWKKASFNLADAKVVELALIKEKKDCEGIFPWK